MRLIALRKLFPPTPDSLRNSFDACFPPYFLTIRFMALFTDFLVFLISALGLTSACINTTFLLGSATCAFAEFDAFRAKPQTGTRFRDVQKVRQPSPYC